MVIQPPFDILGGFWPALRPWNRAPRPFSVAVSRFRSDSSHRSGALMEDQTVEVVGQVRQGQFGFGASHAYGADEQAELALLMRENMVDAGPDG